MHTITAIELKDMMEQENSVSPVLLDVRTADEINICMIDGSVHMPMDDIAERHHELDQHKTYVCICHHGIRSARVALFLMGCGFNNVINLEGGIDAWARDIEPTTTRY